MRAVAGANDHGVSIFGAHAMMLRQALATISVALLVCGCAVAPPALHVPPGETLSPTVLGVHPVHVVSHGWHTGLVLPAALLRSEIPALAERFPAAEYLEVGWGDEGFYQASEITAGLALQAMFWSRGSVLHVVGVSSHPAQYLANSKIRSVCLTPDGYRRLRSFIHTSFARDATDAVTTIGPGLYGNSAFYAGKGRYHLLNTCNSWTAKALASGGLPLRAQLQLSAGGLMASIDSLPFASCTPASDIASDAGSPPPHQTSNLTP
jgi:uncharacterized protein (TIGR02117 family)